MAQTGYTPISIYYSSTSTNVPTAGNLVAGELAINTADGKLFYKDSAGVVQVIGTKGGVGSSTTTQVLYNSSGLVVGSANMTFSGTALTLANDASISGLTVGKGGGAVASATAFGYQAAYTNTTGTNLTAIGYQAGYTSNATDNTFVGRQAGQSTSSGGSNTALGSTALANNSTGADNTALGKFALVLNTTGTQNTSVGKDALYSNTTASNNTSVGYQSLYSNTTASYGTAVGYQALYFNTTGANNTAFGTQALKTNTTGAYNVAIGGFDASNYSALYANTTGSNNTALGSGALTSNTTASNNTAVGYQAGYTGTTSAYNTYLGYQAGYTANYSGNGFNTCIGAQVGYSLTTGYGNTFIGGASSSSGYYVTTGSNNTILGGYTGNQGGLDIRTVSNNIVLSDGAGNPRYYFDAAAGDWVMNQVSAGYWCTTTYKNQAGYSFKSGITAGTNPGYVVYNASNVGVYVSYGATSWTGTSDERLKNITGEISNGLNKVNQLRAVEFTWKSDDTNKDQVGLVAQDVQAVLPQAVSEDNEGNLGVRYTEVIPLLVAAIKELKAEFDAYKATHP